MYYYYYDELYKICELFGVDRYSLSISQEKEFAKILDELSDEIQKDLVLEKSNSYTEGYQDGFSAGKNAEKDEE